MSNKYPILKRVFIEPLQDGETGRFSHARIIAMLVAIAATIFMWKLIIAGTVSLEFFIAYLAYGTGHQAVNKYLDGRRNLNMNMSMNSSPGSRVNSNIGVGVGVGVGMDNRPGGRPRPNTNLNMDLDMDIGGPDYGGINPRPNYNNYPYSNYPYDNSYPRPNRAHIHYSENDPIPRPSRDYYEPPVPSVEDEENARADNSRKILKVDMSGKMCERCNKGHYQTHTDGMLICLCGHKISRWKKYVSMDKKKEKKGRK